MNTVHANKLLSFAVITSIKIHCFRLFAVIERYTRQNNLFLSCKMRNKLEVADFSFECIRCFNVWLSIAFLHTRNMSHLKSQATKWITIFNTIWGVVFGNKCLMQWAVIFYCLLIKVIPYNPSQTSIVDTIKSLVYIGLFRIGPKLNPISFTWIALCLHLDRRVIVNWDCSNWLFQYFVTLSIKKVLILFHS